LKELKEKLTNLTFVIPLIVVFLLIILIPFIQVIRLSFFKEAFDGSLTFVGLKNYIRLFQQANFMEVLLNTLAFTFGGVLLKVGSGFILALILYENFKFKNVFCLALDV